MTKNKKKKVKQSSPPMNLRALRPDVSTWLEEKSIETGLSKSAIVNRLVDYVKDNTHLEML